MNILPKKSWHVRRKENIAKVRKDEAEAAEKEKESQRRVKLAEQEVRVAFLRKRAREKFHPEGSEALDTEPEEALSEQTKQLPPASLNFFEDEEAGIQKGGTNKEHEEENKKVKEDYEKKIGLLTYLGQDSLEAKGGKPWFEDGRGFIVKKGRYVIDDEVGEVGLKGKLALDPLKDIIKYTDIGINDKGKALPKLTRKDVPPPEQESDFSHKKKSKKNKTKHKRCKNKRLSDHEDEPAAKRIKKHNGECHRKHMKRKSKKCKHQKHKASKESSPAISESEATARKEAQLAQMREERLKREELERKRTERLLAGKDPDVEEPPQKDPVPFKQKYNSQFNPQIAKQNYEPKGLQSGVKYWLE